MITAIVMIVRNFLKKPISKTALDKNIVFGVTL